LLLEQHLCHGAVDRYSGVVDPGIEAARPPERYLGDPSHLALIGHVRDHGRGLAVPIGLTTKEPRRRFAVSPWCAERVADQRDAPTNWAQARARIDRGETGDKIAAPDPAVVPLGTDAEAGRRCDDGGRHCALGPTQDAGSASRIPAEAPRKSPRSRLVP
jgi:hypothetical protein